MVFGIVVIGYNRMESLHRLLTALDGAQYGNERPLLIISLDRCNDEIVRQKMLKIAEGFSWNYGKKEIIAYDIRLGLKEHILKCGGYMEKYNLDALIVFEDDVEPSRAFFNYAKQAAEYYENDDRIAGISLYSYRRNVVSNMPFMPAYSNSDVYYMNLAQSWGQVWIRSKWEEFIKWYQINANKEPDSSGVPSWICAWPSESSWLKYHIWYCIEKKKYFVYPYKSLTTNYMDEGEHSGIASTLFQVPMEENPDYQYVFERLSDSSVKYDAYFEREMSSWDRHGSKTIIDLYGSKYHDQRYSGYDKAITTLLLDYKIDATFGLCKKPHEVNAITNTQGEGIFLYDLSVKEKNKYLVENIRSKRRYYYCENDNIKDYLTLCIRLIIEKLRKRIR